jgi:DNA-binding Lrp family transcriptional regulator
MDAFLYCRVNPGRVPTVVSQLPALQGVKRAITVVGTWDVLAALEGQDLSTLAGSIVSKVHRIEGIERTFTAPVVPADRVGISFSSVGPPVLDQSEACYVHIKAQAGAIEGLVERLAEVQDVAGLAVIAGPYDLLVQVRQPWEVASGIIIDQIHPLPGVDSTMTLVGVAYDEPEEDRDQFSAWQ